MPAIGDIKKAQELGFSNGKFIWHACETCGKERWVHLVRNSPEAHNCSPCSLKKAHKEHPESWLGVQNIGANNPKWKGGRLLTDRYIFAWVAPDDFFSLMHRKGKANYVLEHRLIMAKHLGRCLQSWEVVHHKNGDKQDNRIENLELAPSNGDHSKLHSKGYKDGYQKGLLDGRDKQIKELKSEIERLKSLVGGLV